MFTPLTGRVVIVTGGSKGIGKGIAEVFAEQGAQVMIAARGEEDASRAVAAIRDGGGTAAYTVCDVTDESQVDNLVRHTAEQFGGIDILCANAGIFPQKKIIDLSGSEWDDVLRANLKSSFLCVKACLPYFERAGSGRIIITSSITGPITGYPGWAHYGASKAGQLGFIKTAALELSRYHTTINAVMPGNIRTEGLDDLGQDYLDTMAASIPLKRLGSVRDIGYAAVFFASQEAAYITGQTLIVDGGQILPESLEALQEI
jgi:3-oxoacyl-[acyl-carrier protein] reductase